MSLVDLSFGSDKIKKFFERGMKLCDIDVYKSVLSRTVAKGARRV
jgi:hypothetical protein